MRGASDQVVRLRMLWADHTRRPFPPTTADPRVQEVLLYSSWIGSMVEVVLRTGSIDRNLAEMLKTRRAEGNQRLFRAAGELGEPVRSFVARLIAIEDLLAEWPL
ncbi:MAG: hypothetical protein ACREOM_01780 [Candidatus Dormibacteraceae bacterium]